MTIIAFIFARGGSKGLPGKNLRPLGGKPLIAWSIAHALAVDRIDRVIVSTDSQEIASTAMEYGAEVPFLRPAELALDSSPEWLAWRHALNYLQNSEGMLPDVMLSLPTTAPLRLPVDIENCLDAYYLDSPDIVITTTEAHRSPYFNMVKKNLDGSFGLVIPPVSQVTRRQDAPEVFDMTTVVYAAKPEFVLKKNSMFEGRVQAVQVPKDRAIDIDTIHDFELAEYFLQKRNSKGSLD